MTSIGLCAVMTFLIVLGFPLPLPKKSTATRTVVNSPAPRKMPVAIPSSSHSSNLIPNQVTISESAAMPSGGTVHWHRFKHPKGLFEADMPSDVQLDHSNSILPLSPGVIARVSVRPPPGVNIDALETYTASAGKVRCSLEVAKLPPAAERYQTKAEFDQLAEFLVGSNSNDLVERAFGKNVVEFPLIWEHAIGRDIAFTTERYDVFGRCVVSRSFQGMAILVAPKDVSSAPMRMQFFGSLTLDEPGHSKLPGKIEFMP